MRNLKLLMPLAVGAFLLSGCVYPPYYARHGYGYDGYYGDHHRSCTVGYWGRDGRFYCSDYSRRSYYDGYWYGR